MAVVERLWPGETAVVLASGPSLCPEDCAYVRGKARVIAVNDAWKLAPFADVLYASDETWWAKHQGVPMFNGLKYSISASRKHRGFARTPDVCVLKNAGTLGLSADPAALRHGFNSGYAAINLAVHLGVSRILLLGYNLMPVNGHRHFTGYVGGVKHGGDFNKWLLNFQSIVQPLAALGVAVVNCTHPTRLTAFPRATLREVLA